MQDLKCGRCRRQAVWSVDGWIVLPDTDGKPTWLVCPTCTTPDERHFAEMHEQEQRALDAFAREEEWRPDVEPQP